MATRDLVTCNACNVNDTESKTHVFGLGAWHDRCLPDAFRVQFGAPPLDDGEGPHGESSPVR